MAETVVARLRNFYRRHYWFLVLLVLFASFRLLAILLFRPGGFIADNSDYDFYYAVGTHDPHGLHHLCRICGRPTRRSSRR